MSDDDVRSGEPRRRRAAIQADRLERYRRMVEIRIAEERILELFGEGLIPGTTHTSQGQEAVCVAIAAATRPTDTVACTYRGHGLALALGMTQERVMGEILGRQIGCMGGLGGSMHLSDPSVGLLPTFAIVGAGIPIGAGAALTAQVLGTDDVAISVFGDGATNIGAFHEGLNLASIWKLPVVFVCENNQYGEYTRINLTTPVEDIAVRSAVLCHAEHDRRWAGRGRRRGGLGLRRRPGQGRRRPHVGRGQDLPLRRAFALRQGDLPAGRRTRQLAGARPDKAVR